MGKKGVEKMEKKLQKLLSYRLQFINSTRLMASALWNLVNNLTKKIHKFNENTDTTIKNAKLAKLNVYIAIVFLNTQIFKYFLIEYKCLCCNKNYQLKLDKKLKERFFNTYTFSNHDNSKFILLLRKGVSWSWCSIS